MSAVKKDVSICNRTGLDVGQALSIQRRAKPLTARKIASC
jgi:hypothetical protein